MQKGVLWNGKNYQIPQAASRIDSSNLTPVSLGGTKRVALLGFMNGLVPPGQVTRIDSPSHAKQLLHPDLEEMRLAAQVVFSPSQDVPGASEVYLVPVNPAVRSSITLSSALKLTSIMYGLPANQVKVKVETGTARGKKITLAYQDSTDVFDDLAKDSFQIQYTGAGSAAVMSITPTVAAHSLTTTCTDATGDNLNLDLNVYTTIQALADAIQATGKYTVTIKTPSPKTDRSIQLDSVSGQDIRTGVYTVLSSLQYIVDTLNARPGYATAERVADAGTVPANAAYTYFTGGLDGAYTSAEWTDALDLLGSVSMQIVVPVSTDTAIHTLADTHVNLLSGPDYQLERRAFVGGVLRSWGTAAARATSLAALKTEVNNLNSDRTVHAGLGTKHYDPNGVAKLYASHITAAMYAGIAAGTSPVEPLTKKHLKCLGLETELRKSEIDMLMEYGVACPAPDRIAGGGFLIVRQVTTWNSSIDLYRIEFSVGQGADYIAAQVRARHEDLIGKPGTIALDQTLINITNAVLQEALLNDYIRSYDPKKTALRAVGTSRYIDYSAEPILPVNNIFSTYHLMPTFSILLAA